MLVNPISLATLPLRLAMRGAELLLRAAGAAVGATGGDPEEHPYATATAPVRERESATLPDERRPPAREAPVEEPVAAEPAEAPEVEDPAAAEPAAAAPAAATPAVEEPVVPDHVSEEPVLVEEFADPGAEDGAGPEISVAEPWPAYATMKANEVIARLEQAAPAEVAVARLYEHANRRRKTVLAAADRRLKLLDA